MSAAHVLPDETYGPDCDDCTSDFHEDCRDPQITKPCRDTGEQLVLRCCCWTEDRSSEAAIERAMDRMAS